MAYTASFWIEKLQLITHVEGGSYREIYRSPFTLTENMLPKTFTGERNISTSIYFLLEKNQFSAFHRIASDELWHFYEGDGLVIYEIDAQTGEMIVHRVGRNPEKNELFQSCVKAGNWFASCVAEGGEYSLSGCTVSPGFDFADFKLAERNTLTSLYPQHSDLISRLTRQ